MQFAHFGAGFQEAAQGFDTPVEIVLDGIEIAVVILGDFLRDFSAAYPVDIFGCNVERADHRIEHVVESLDDGPEIALVL